MFYDTSIKNVFYKVRYNVFLTITEYFINNQILTKQLKKRKTIGMVKV